MGGARGLSIGLLGALTVTSTAATLRQGAFHRGDALAVACVALVIIVFQLVLGLDRRALAVVVATLALAAWWMLSALLNGVARDFLPLGASVLGFGAACITVGRLEPRLRTAAALVVVAIGTASAIVGMGAEALRIYPEAARAQGLWRVATTLTYSNAAGALLAMTTLVALAQDACRWWARVAVYLGVASLAATQSRGAILALALALGFVPRVQLHRHLASMLTGVGVGVVFIAQSSGSQRTPIVLLCGAVGGLLVAAVPVLRRPQQSRPWTLREYAVGVLVGLVLVGAGVGLTRSEIATRTNEDRAPEWHAALVQWESAPALGVGPDKVLVIDKATRTTAYFAHSEYLQVLADAGLVGLALLVVLGVVLVLDLRRHDVLSSCAVGAVVCFAVTGAVDFCWHLPAVGLLGGWVAGLASASSPDSLET
jgi:O-antigen ligase